METPSFETLFQAAQRRGVVAALQRLPDTTIADLCAFLKGGSERAALLADVTISELTTAPILSAGGIGSPIDHVRRHRAKRSAGEEYDALVHEVLREAPDPVAASYLRARVGGPRWKLQASLGRLMVAGKVARRGMTSGTRYWAMSRES